MAKQKSGIFSTTDNTLDPSVPFRTNWNSDQARSRRQLRPRLSQDTHAIPQYLVKDAGVRGEQRLNFSFRSLGIIEPMKVEAFYSVTSWP